MAYGPKMKCTRIGTEYVSGSVTENKTKKKGRWKKWCMKTKPNKRKLNYNESVSGWIGPCADWCGDIKWSAMYWPWSEGRPTSWKNQPWVRPIRAHTPGTLNAILACKVRGRRQFGANNTSRRLLVENTNSIKALRRMPHVRCVWRDVDAQCGGNPTLPGYRERGEPMVCFAAPRHEVSDGLWIQIKGHWHHRGGDHYTSV